jgi:hypothetical protein
LTATETNKVSQTEGKEMTTATTEKTRSASVQAILKNIIKIDNQDDLLTEAKAKTAAGYISFYIWQGVNDFEQAEQEYIRLLKRLADDTNNQQLQIANGEVVDPSWIASRVHTMQQTATTMKNAVETITRYAMIRNAVIEESN